MAEGVQPVQGRPPRRRGAAQTKAEWLALGVALLALAAVIGTDLHSSRRALETSERDRLEHQARSAMERLGSRLEAVSSGLRSFVVEATGLLRQADGRALLDERLRVMASSMTGVRSLLLVDADGIVVASNREELLGGDWHEGERYRTIRGRPDAALLYVSPPFMTPLGSWTISLGRAKLDARGAFDGYALAIIDPAFLRSELDSARYAPDMTVAVVHGGGKVIYRVPDPAGVIGLDVSAVPGSAFNKHVRSGQPFTLWDAPITSTGRESLIALQSIRPSTTPSDGFLVAVFARDTAALLGPWWRDARDRAALLAVAALASGLALGVFQRRRAAIARIEAEREAERKAQGEAQRAIETRLRLALETSRAGTWEWDLRTGGNTWSDNLWELYGLDRATAAPSYAAWLESVLPEDRAGAEAAVTRGAAEGAPIEIEYRVARPGAPVRWLLARGRPVRGPGGEVERYLGIAVDVTESKRSADLQVENARLGALDEAVSRLPIGVAITELGADGEPLLVSANAAHERIVGPGTTPGAAVSALPYRIFQPDRVTPVAPRDRPGPRAARTGTPSPLTEAHLRRADGTWRVILATAVPITSHASAAPPRAITLVVDVTAEREAAEAARSTGKRYQGLVELSPNAVVVSRRGLIELVNRAALELLGAKRPEEVLGRSPLEFYHPDFHALYRKRLAALEEQGTVAPPVRTRIVRPDGTVRDVEATASPFQDDRGTAVQAVVRDITDELRREEALRESEQRFRAIFEGAADGIVTADPATGRLLTCNPTFTRMTGYTEEELRGLRFQDLHDPQDLSAVGVIFSAMAAGRARTAPGTPVRRKDGTLFTADIASARVTFPDGTYLAGFFRDVTEQRKAEADLRSLQSQLAQSQKLEGIGRLAGGVAHDFNNILSVIQGCAAFLLKGVQDGTASQDDVLEIQKAAARAASLTRQLLAFSRRQALQPVTLDLNQSLDAMEKMLRRIIGEDVALVKHLAPDLWSVKADPGQVEQVIMNLAVNARDAMPEGGTLTIETANAELDEGYAASHAGTTPGPHVMMAISDSGVGMDEGTLSRIFEPFFTTKGPGQGTGLGLATVYGVVAQSGGSIRVHSEPGHGTTFRIYLPRDLSPAGAPGPRGPPRATPAVRGETVLLVEDDPAVRGITERILAAGGYRVVAAASGAEALRACEQHAGEIHLLLTDVVMPAMSGRELAERLSAGRPGLKVLFMSGYTDSAIARHGVLGPGSQFIGKPFSQADLLAKVRDVLEPHAP